MTNPTPPVPVRAVGLVSLTAVSINTSIGAGIFALPATVAQLLGAAGPLAYLAAGAAVLLITSCFAELGSRFEATGGPYVYARAAFGGLAGFEVAWLFVLSRLTAAAAISNTFSDYLGYFWPALAHGAGRLGAITFMIGTLAFIHFIGVRVGTVVNNILTVGKLIPLFAFCLAGAYFLDFHPVLAMPAPKASSLQQASLLLLFALGGFESASVPTEEVIEPRKNLPRALFASVGFVVALYLAVHVVAMAALPGLASSATPLASAARIFLGAGGALLLTAGAVVSTAGTNHVILFVGPRLLYALARDRQLPPQFARLNPRYRTPAFSIWWFAAAVWALAVSSAFGPLAALSALARLLVYAVTCLAVLAMRRRTASTPSGFTLAGGALIPVLAVGACGWLLTGISIRQGVLALAALLAGGLLYGWLGERAPKGVHS